MMSDPKLLQPGWGLEKPDAALPLSGREFLVGHWMTTPVKVVARTVPVMEAYDMMIHWGIRRLPVVEGERLVGLVTLGDLREARPSRATSLSIYELNSLLARLTVDEVMTHNPFVVTAETPVIEAAKVMLHHKIGGLPVVDNTGRPVGIITESDLFRLLIQRWDYFVG